MWGPGYGAGGMGVGMLGMTLFWLVLLVLVVVGVAALVRGVFRMDEPPARREKRKALEILKERYARGEIEREEFEQKKHDLGG